MADIEPQQTDHLLGDSFPRYVPRQRDSHARSVGVLSVDNGQLDSQWESVPSAVRNGPVPTQGALQDPRHINLAHYDMGVEEYRPLSDNPAAQVPNTYLEIGFDQVNLERERTMYPDSQRNGPFGYALQGAVRDHTQAALPGPSSYQNTGLREPATGDLRRLASRYLYHPDSQVDMVRMEPGSAGRYKVVIVVEIADLF